MSQTTRHQEPMKPNSTQQLGPFCQSCAMPLATPEDFGMDATGVRNNDYCSYCFKAGKFTAPDMTMEQMRDFCVDKMVELKVMPRAEALSLMRKVMPGLKRWAT